MSDSKIARSFAELADRVSSARAQGKRIVLCHGVFDLLHPGHILHLQTARTFGDVLVVTLTPDRFVNKGPGRPAFNERLRALTIASIEAVDHVTVNESPTAIDLIDLVKPDVYVKGIEYADPANDVTGKISDEVAAVRRNGGKVQFTDEQTYSSSNLINRFLSPYPESTQAYLDTVRRDYTPEAVIEKLESYRAIRPLVVGEVILDEYCYATPLAKAPREAIIAAKFESLETFAGGAAATANHLAGFCDEVTLLASIGPDAEHQRLLQAKLAPNVNFVPIVTPDRTTVTKRRFLQPGHLTKLFEIQYLDDTDCSEETETRAIKAYEELTVSHDLTAVNDFGHGFLTPRLRQQIYGYEGFLALNTQTNSANLGFNPITKYPRADYCCIDEAEARLASRMQHEERPVYAAMLRAALHARWFMTTIGREGSFLTADDGCIYRSPALSPVVIDRVGAGDAFFALTAPWAYRGYPPELTGFVGNCVGALKVGQVGNRSPVTPVALYKFITSLLK